MGEGSDVNPWEVPGASAVWWIRRYLRLTDNQALASALAQAEQVMPVFILDSALWFASASAKRLAFLLNGLCQLDADLRAKGSRLIIRQGHPLDHEPWKMPPDAQRVSGCVIGKD